MEWTTAAVLIAQAVWGPNAAIVAALGAFLGHLFPVWLGFKGGKGVATFLGVLLALSPVALAAFAAERKAAALPGVAPLPSAAHRRKMARAAAAATALPPLPPSPPSGPPNGRPGAPSWHAAAGRPERSGPLRARLPRWRFS